MDQLDRYIESIVSKKISEPENLDQIIMDAISIAKEKKKIKDAKRKKIILTSIITVFCLSGVGIAGYITYEKVWKNPEKYTYEEIQESLADANKIDIRNEIISEEQAKENASTIMNNLGYEDEEIKSIELQKDVNNNDKPFYNILTGNNENEGIAIKLNANTGDIISFANNNFKNTNIKESSINNEQAKEYSDEIIDKIGLAEKEYQFTECTEKQLSHSNEVKNVWVATYHKLYDGIYNPYEVLTNSFVINNNKIEICSIIETADGTYDNNPTVITEEEAIQIATNKEREFTSREIESTSAEIGIRKMNSYIYMLENNLENGFDNEKYDKNIMMKENKVRKVWIVKIIHNNTNENIDNLNSTQKIKNANKLYYVDITTKEIIGGEELIEGGS